MMNAAERATRTAQAKHQHNTAVLKEIEVLMDAAMDAGENALQFPKVIHGDAIEELETTGYTVTINHYSGTNIAW